MTLGARNLLILGCGAIIITLVTTSVSLFIYRETGDIYLDRSRPGYLPDEEEATEESANTTTYTYPETGTLDADELDEYLQHLRQTIDRLDAYSDPYSANSLSDESLGIPSADATDTTDTASTD